MNTEKDIVVQFSKTKILAQIGLVLFLIFFFGLLLFTFTSESTARTTLFQVIAIPLITVLVLLFFSNIRRLFTNSPGIVINAKGITDNSSYHGVGFIPWNDISSLSVAQIRYNQYLVLGVVNPQKYISRGNLLLRVQRLANNVFFNSPIFIISNSLEIDFSEMVDLIKHSYRKFKSA